MIYYISDAVACQDLDGRAPLVRLRDERADDWLPVGFAAQATMKRRELDENVACAEQLQEDDGQIVLLQVDGLGARVAAEIIATGARS